MREIKFRVWVNKRMLNVTTLSLPCNETHEFMSFSHPSNNPGLKEGVGFSPRGSIFMQYTGLKDKNGKEIYEGDVVVSGMLNDDDWIPENAIIKWDEEYCSFHQELLRTKYNGDPDWQLMDVPCEVIGNIYENSELL